MRTHILFLVFSLCAFVAVGQSISSAEYFFDADPGIGNGTSVALNGNTGQLTQSLAIPTTGIPEGFHSFYIRTRNSSGNWSHYDRVIVYVTSFTNTSGPITAAEYFFDTDPGEGKGMALAVDANIGLLTQSFIIPTTGLAEGTHTYFIRVQDENGSWSVYDSASITISVGAIDNSVILQGTVITANYAATGASYQWIDCDTDLPIAGEVDRSFEVSESGSYAVEITDGSENVTSECLAVVVLPDDDSDGVPNDVDACPQTSQNAIVDVTGCAIFSLPTTNFTILSKGESCTNSDNGSIEIDAQEDLNYTAILTGDNVSLTNTFSLKTLFENLVTGNYTLCMTVEGQPGFERCQDVIITEPETLSVSSKINTSDSSVSLHLKGGKSYTINLNDEVYNTSEQEITLPLSEVENSLSVKADAECQGIFQETIVLSSKTLTYPNPVGAEEITVNLGNVNAKTVELVLYSSTGKEVLKNSQNVVGHKIRLNMDGLSSGMYLLHIKTNHIVLNYKIIRR